MEEKSIMATKIDKTLLLLTIIILFFLWSNIVSSNLITRFIFSVAIGSATYFLLNTLYGKLTLATKLKKDEHSLAIKIRNTLINADPIKTNKFFEYALSKKFTTKAISHNVIETVMENGDSAIFILAHYSSAFTKKDLVQIYVKFLKFNKIFIISPSFDNECILTCKKLTKFILLDTFLTYKLLKFLKVFPKTNKTNPKTKFWNLFINSLNRNNAKKYIKIGLLFLLGSIFVTSNWFYRIFSTIALCLSIICILRKGPVTETSSMFFD